MEIQELIMKCELKLTVFSPDGKKKIPEELSRIINRLVNDLNSNASVPNSDDITFNLKVMPNTVTEIIKLR